MALKTIKLCSDRKFSGRYISSLDMFGLTYCRYCSSDDGDMRAVMIFADITCLFKNSINKQRIDKI